MRVYIQIYVTPREHAKIGMRVKTLSDRRHNKFLRVNTASGANTANEPDPLLTHFPKSKIQQSIILLDGGEVQKGAISSQLFPKQPPPPTPQQKLINKYCHRLGWEIKMLQLHHEQEFFASIVTCRSWKH